MKTHNKLICLLTSYRESLQVLCAEVNNKLNVLSHDSSKIDYVDEDEYIVSHTIDIVDDLLTDLRRAGKSKLLKLNMTNYKNNKL